MNRIEKRQNPHISGRKYSSPRLWMVELIHRRRWLNEGRKVRTVREQRRRKQSHIEGTHETRTDHRSGATV